MPPLAAQLPDGLLDAFRLAALEGTSHVEREAGPFCIEVRLFRREKTQPIEWALKVIQKEWRGP